MKMTTYRAQQHNSTSGNRAKFFHVLKKNPPCSIGHSPLSSASPVNLRLRVGPRALSEKKRIREQGVKNLVCPSVWNAPKENKLGVNK